jgi:hypothetical protein
MNKAYFHLKVSDKKFVWYPVCLEVLTAIKNGLLFRLSDFDNLRVIVISGHEYFSGIVFPNSIFNNSTQALKFLKETGYKS